MKSFFKVKFICLSLVFCISNQSFTQTKEISNTEKNLVKIYDKLTSIEQDNYDSISFYSNKFDKEFSSLIENTPETIDYSFNELIKCNPHFITTSNDGNFRIYSWDTFTGGTMHFFKNIYQWKLNGKVFTQVSHNDEDDSRSFCSDIYTININNKPHYLAITNAIFSTKDMMQSATAYTITDNKLDNAVQLFKTKTQSLNHIDVSFDFFSVVDRPERPVKLITYDDEQKIVRIPVVTKKGKVTKKNILYQLKNQKFEFTGFEKGK